MTEKVYQAYGTGGTVIRETPRAAAMAYFEQAPKSRKCNVVQGTVDGDMSWYDCAHASRNGRPKSYKDVTKKGAADLPG